MRRRSRLTFDPTLFLSIFSTSIHKDRYHIYNIMLPKPILNDTPQEVEALYKSFQKRQEAKAKVVLAQQAIERVNKRIEQGAYTQTIGKFALFARQLELNRAITRLKMCDFRFEELNLPYGSNIDLPPWEVKRRQALSQRKDCEFD